MIRAVIDLGTNTFNLLIAEVLEGKLNIIDKTKEAVLLGMGGINDGYIADDALARAMDTLTHFSESCEHHNVPKENILGIGTSALRAAKNSSQFVDQVFSELKIRIEIIPGKDEAQLIYQGVKWTYDFSSPAVIMDIGGGSTEFILANESNVVEMESFEIGVSRIFQYLEMPSSYTPTHIQAVLEYMEEREVGQLSKFSCDTMIGSSGSFETFYEMINQKEFVPTGSVVELNMTELMEQLDWSINSSLEDRMNNRWIVPIRKNMLPISAIQIKWAIEKLGIKRMLLSSYSLKEGVLNKF